MIKAYNPTGIGDHRAQGSGLRRGCGGYADQATAGFAGEPDRERAAGEEHRPAGVYAGGGEGCDQDDLKGGSKTRCSLMRAENQGDTSSLILSIPS